MYFQPDDSKMPAQRQNNPITEMLVEGYQNTIFSYSFLQDLPVISPCLPCF